VNLDPAYARAHAALAAANWRLAASEWESALSKFQRAYEKVLYHLGEAMKSPTDLGYAVSAEILTQQGRFTEALAEIRHALALSPNDAETHISKAKVLSAMGRAVEAEEAARWAMRLDPQYPPDYLRTLAVALFLQEHYDKALEAIDRVVKRQPDVVADYVTLVSALGHLGRSDGLEAAVIKFNDLSVPAGYSPLTVQEANWWWYGDIYSYDRTYRDRLVEGLRKAGVPEGSGTDVAYDDYIELIRRTAGESEVLGATKIDVEMAKSLHDRGVTFVDVRAATGFARGRIPRSVNLDLAVDLSKENLLRVVNPSDEVVFGCHGRYCPYSAYASAKALKWGFTKVYYFAGGFPAWEEAGYPVETEPTQ
jgi:tetratricopeptide (TPR) repeat protein